MTRNRVSTLFRPLAALTGVVVMVIAAAGCSVNPATGRQSFTMLMPPAEEARVGQKLHPEVSKEFGGATLDRARAAYVDRVGQSLARHTEFPDQRFTFTMLDSDIVNAFAVPGGYVYVTRALVALAGSEAELAGVLAHEIGHVTARHTAERYSQAAVAQLLLGVGSQVIGGSMNDLMQLGAAAYLKGFSREQEYESDLLGVRYLLRAGYEPRAMGSFLAKLRAESQLRATLMGRSGEADQYSIMSTHPRTADRVERALKAAKASAGLPWIAKPRVGVDEYMQRIDGLYVDGDPRNGFIKGRRFVHPAGRFQFMAPPGFRLFKGGESAVLVLGPEESAARLDWVEERRRMTMGDYLTGVWARQHRVEGVERITINGLEAATGTLRGAAGRQRVVLRLIAVRSGPATIHRMTFLMPETMVARLSEEFRRTTYSFRRLTPAEAARETPFRLRVRRAQPGENTQSLASRMPYESHRMQRFQVLNGLDRGQQIRPGQWIKQVVE